jgi:hypothetical protein
VLLYTTESASTISNTGAFVDEPPLRPTNKSEIKRLSAHVKSDYLTSRANVMTLADDPEPLQKMQGPPTVAEQFWVRISRPSVPLVPLDGKT